MMENLYLAHHGVKGMKWGVRRTPEQLGHPGSKREAKAQMKAKNALAKQEFKSARGKAYSKYYKQRDEIESRFDKSLTESERNYKHRRDTLNNAAEEAEFKRKYMSKDAEEQSRYATRRDAARAASMGNDWLSYGTKQSLEEKEGKRDADVAKASAKRAARVQKANAAYRKAKTMNKADYRMAANNGRARFYDSKAVKQELARRLVEN